MSDEIQFGELTLLVEKSELNAQTGSRTYYVRVHEKLDDNQELTGPISQYSCDVDTLLQTYGGDYQRFLVEKVKEREIMRYRGLKHASAQGEKLDGVRL